MMQNPAFGSAPPPVLAQPIMPQDFRPLPMEATAPSVVAAPGFDPLLPFIVPQARDRWLSVLVRGYTPELIEGILRGAFSGNLLYQWQLFDLMEGTWPHLQKDLNELKRAVRSMDVSVAPYAEKGKEPTPEAQQRADLVERALREMLGQPAKDQNDLGATIYDLLDAWGKGISVLEIDWELRASTGQPPAYLPKGTRWIHPWNYGYPSIGADLMLDTTRINTQVNAIPTYYQPLRPIVQQYAPFPDNKFLLSIVKQKSGHPIGGAMLRVLAWWWCAANFSSEWLLNYAQLFGIPFRWAEYDQTKPGLLDLIQQMMENMGSAGWAAFPAGTKLQFMEGAKSAAENPQAYVLTFADKIADIVILGQTLTTDVGGSGSRALGEVHEGVRGDILEGAGTHVSNIFSHQFAPAVLYLNFGDRALCPTVFLGAEEVTDAKDLADRDATLLDRGVEMPAEWFYRRHDIPQPQPGQAVIKKAAAPLPGGIDADQASVQAKDATEQLAENVMQNVTGVEARWLGGIKPLFVRLAAAAQSHKLTDEDFIRVVETAAKNMPELFPQLKTKELAKELENTMATALVNGVAKGVMLRGGGSVTR
ncbi:MAG TPA: DUF935 family protein [Verrucomicrobiae bacterium]|jgi:phage gp29-like protein|nr:DUF935 family protein [Verrucomicrobiae bacterium]